MTSPCKGCQKRTLGCHDVNTCEKWREYVEEQKKVIALKREITDGGNDWERHQRRHGRKVPRR